MTRGEPGFEARFPDVCRRCGRDVIPGQRVLPRGPEHVIHVGCASGHDED